VKRFLILTAASVLTLAPPLTLAARPKPVAPALVPAAIPDADFRVVDPENVLVIDTTKGRVIVEMVPEMAPAAVAQIKALTRENFYDGLTFHRVVDDFMAQGGDPKGDGTGGSTKPNIPGEFTFRRGADNGFVPVEVQNGLQDGFLKSVPVRTQADDLMVMTADNKVAGWGVWCQGVAGMARAGAPDSGNSQFYLMRQFNGALEKNYTVWGRVIVGLDVVRALKTGEPVINPDKMTSVRILADLPVATRPKLSVLDAHSPSFKALAAAALGGRSDTPSVCNIDLPVRVK
jgi:peptidylprolyl isomerase